VTAAPASRPTSAPRTPTSSDVPSSWPDLTSVLVAGQDLSARQTAWAMDSVMSGAATPVQLAGFLVALRSKGETVAELTGLADAMLDHSVPCRVDGPTLDIVGTGGDRAHTVNISTMSAIVLAGTGITVVKHGNRASSSSSGSADVLEALGIRLDQPARRVAEIASEVGITFCFAQVFHPSMKHAAAARRDLGIPTAFNFLGPLTNPSQPRATAVGVADARMAPIVAGVFGSRGTQALVFRGQDGLDELAATSLADVWEVRDGVVTTSTLDAVGDLGLTPISVDDLRGADAAYNAGVAQALLDGSTGPVRETVLLNAAAALVADGSLAGTSEGTLVERLTAGMRHAADSIDSGSARGVLDRWAAAAA
jgi:anthranilate phosphoribosyltransferase